MHNYASHKYVTQTRRCYHGNYHIKLGQALKAAGLVDSGVEAKFAVQDGLVKVNGETEYQRGKKLYDGDTVVFEGNEIKITK